MHPGRPFPTALAAELRSIVGPANLVEAGESLEILSKDF